MKIKKVSATEARNNFFELLNMVKYGDQVVDVYKNDKLTVRMSMPGDQGKIDWGEKLVKLKSKMPILTKEDEKQVEKIRAESKINKYPEW